MYKRQADQLAEANKALSALPPPPPSYPVAQPIARPDRPDLEPAAPKGIDPAVLDGVAERLEALAERLEREVAD